MSSSQIHDIREDPVSKFSHIHTFQVDLDLEATAQPGASHVTQRGEKLPANAGVTGDASSTPGSGRSPGGGNGNPLQSSCLGKPMDRGAWGATVHWVVRVGRG